MINVLIADDQRLMRDGLSTLLGLEDFITIIGTASDGNEAYEEAQKLRPDVVLMDIRMPNCDGIEGTCKIKNECPDVKILMLTTFDDSELIFKALESGASGYLLKDMPSETIVKAIETVHNGGVVLQPNVTKQILDEFKKVHSEAAAASQLQTESPLLADLTAREKEILHHIGHGLNNKEIGELLFISEGTVKNYVSVIISKLGVRDRTQAAVFAFKNGITKF